MGTGHTGVTSWGVSWDVKGRTHHTRSGLEMPSVRPSGADWRPLEIKHSTEGHFAA